MIGTRPPVVPVLPVTLLPVVPVTLPPVLPVTLASDRSRCCFQVGLSDTVAGWRGPAGGPEGTPAGRHFDCVHQNQNSEDQKTVTFHQRHSRVGGTDGAAHPASR